MNMSQEAPGRPPRTARRHPDPPRAAGEDAARPDQGPDDPAEAVYRAILARHQDTIGVRKAAVAVPRLRCILEAALDLSNRKGFQAMSLRELSQASGLSAGGLYAYFDSKTTLLKMILGGVTEAVERGLAHPPPAASADPEAYLRWLIDAHLRLTEAMLPWFTFAFMEAKNFPPAERRLAVDSEALTEGYFAAVLSRGIAAGRFRPDTSPLLPALIKPLLQEWYVKRAKYRRRGVTLESYSATVQGLVLGACLCGGPPAEGGAPGGAEDGAEDGALGAGTRPGADAAGG